MCSWLIRVVYGLLTQGTRTSCQFDQQQNMLQSTTEYFIKMCQFCSHDQQQNADTTNSVVDQMDNLRLYPVINFSKNHLVHHRAG